MKQLLQVTNSIVFFNQNICCLNSIGKFLESIYLLKTKAQHQICQRNSSMLLGSAPDVFLLTCVIKSVIYPFLGYNNSSITFISFCIMTTESHVMF